VRKKFAPLGGAVENKKEKGGTTKGGKGQGRAKDGGGGENFETHWGVNLSKVFQKRNGGGNAKNVKKKKGQAGEGKCAII